MASRIVTTSWDVGHPLDLRVARVLARHGVRGTFYVPLRAVAGGLLSASQMRELLAMGMEIGSHTVTHPILTTLPLGEVDRELRDSRSMLEDLLGREVTSFCYPRGRFNAAIARRAALAGYRVCRTTVDFQTGLCFDPVRMPVSVQLFRHRASTFWRHAARHRNWSGMWNWRRRFRGETDPERLALDMSTRGPREGGIFHLWGHSWEIDQFGLWPALERIAESLGALSNAAQLTNGEVCDAAR